MPQKIHILNIKKEQFITTLKEWELPCHTFCECEQNELDVNIIDNLLKDKDYKKEFNRLCKMQIPGRIDNAFPKIIGTKTKEYLNSVLLN